MVVNGPTASSVDKMRLRGLGIATPLKDISLHSPHQTEI